MAQLTRASAISYFNKVWREVVGTEPPNVTAVLRQGHIGTIRVSIRDADNPRKSYGDVGPKGTHILEQYLPT